MAKNGGRLRNTLPPPVFEWRCIEPIACLRWACHASVGFHTAWFTPRQATWGAWAHFFLCCFFSWSKRPPPTHTHTIPRPTLSCVVVVVDNELNTAWNPKRTISFSFLWTCRNGTVEHIKSTREQNRQTETQARYNSTCFIAPTLSIEMYFLVYAL